MKGTPREKAGFLTLLTFSWINNVLKLGNKQPFEEKHLLPVETSNQAERLVADLEREWLAEGRASEQNRTKPRLWKAMMRNIPGREYATVVLIRICYSLSNNSLPLILWFFLRSISTASRINYSTTLAFVVGIALPNLSVRMICCSHWVYQVEVMAIRLKVAIIGFVYKKALFLIYSAVLLIYLLLSLPLRFLFSPLTSSFYPFLLILPPISTIFPSFSSSILSLRSHSFSSSFSYLLVLAAPPPPYVLCHHPPIHSPAHFSISPLLLPLTWFSSFFSTYVFLVRFFTIYFSFSFIPLPCAFDPYLPDIWKRSTAHNVSQSLGLF